MNPWPFVIAAYSTTIIAVAVLMLWSWRSMLRAEREAEALARK